MKLKIIKGGNHPKTKEEKSKKIADENANNLDLIAAAIKALKNIGK